MGAIHGPFGNLRDTVLIFRVLLHVLAEKCKHILMSALNFTVNMFSICDNLLIYYTVTVLAHNFVICKNCLK